MYYKNKIIKVTGCGPVDASEIEDYMRNIIFHSTLDWQTTKQFNAAARTAYKDILYLRTDAGKKLIEEFYQKVDNL